MLNCLRLAAAEVFLLKGIRLKRKQMAMVIFSSNAMDQAHIKRLVRQKGCSGFEKRKFHENAHSPRQRGGKMEGGREDGMGRG